MNIVTLSLELYATNCKLPLTNSSVLGFYEGNNGSCRHAIVYLDEADGIWYESRLGKCGDLNAKVDKPDLWCSLPQPIALDCFDE